MGVLSAGAQPGGAGLRRGVARRAGRRARATDGPCVRVRPPTLPAPRAGAPLSVPPVARRIIIHVLLLRYHATQPFSMARKDIGGPGYRII